MSLSVNITEILEENEKKLLNELKPNDLFLKNLRESPITQTLSEENQRAYVGLVKSIVKSHTVSSSVALKTKYFFEISFSTNMPLTAIP